MTPRHMPPIQVIHRLRQAAADIVELSDSVIFGRRTTALVDLRAFPERIRALQARCERALEALDRQGIS